MNQKIKHCPFCGEDILEVAIKCKHCGSMLDLVGGDKRLSEEILADVAANLFRGIESVGGRLKITNRRVMFEPHAINFQKIPAEIHLSEIAEVGARNTMGFVPNGVFLRTKSGVEYNFVVWGRAKLIGLIERLILKP